MYATGKRKNAIARVWLSEGKGKITVNNKPANEYLQRAILETIINQPFQKTNTEGKFDIVCSVLGGGLTGQAGAIKHAISIALQLLNPDLRDVLKKAGFLTRDSRVVERKKAGLKKARKGQVYQRR
ncbi:MAG: 30S ribosomal protein S9 [Rickettsiales bacterium]|nr:30S ribosomal protein S9 [Rickettsiales bacterium]